MALAEWIENASEDIHCEMGDIFELKSGNLIHRIGCGDSRDPNLVNCVFDGEKPILMVTDPPYGVNYDPVCRGKSNIKSLNRSQRITKKILNDHISDWNDAYKIFNGSVIYLWCGSLKLKENIQILEDLGFIYKYLIIWRKQTAFNRGNYHWYHECCIYAVKKGFNHNWQGSAKERTLWEIDSLCPLGRRKEFLSFNEKMGHPTQKPFECMARPIRNNTQAGQGVYDPFLGSGTTLIAAEELQRKCFGIEIDPEWIEKSIQRWINQKKKKNEPYEITKKGEK